MSEQKSQSSIVPEQLLQGKVAIYAWMEDPKVTQGERNALLENLKQIAVSYGYKDEQIMVFDKENLLIPLSERFKPTLLECVGRGTVQAILVGHERLLFQYTKAYHINTFINPQINSIIQLFSNCGIFILTPQSVYDIANPQHVKLLRSKYQLAI